MYNKQGHTRESAQKAVGEGWKFLVDKVFDEFEKTNQGKITTVKEKFGALRIYADEVTDELYDLIWQLEKDSKKICEICGKEGFTRLGDYVQTLCEEHGSGRELWSHINYSYYVSDVV